MKLLALLLVPSVAFADLYASVGTGFRDGFYNASIGYHILDYTDVKAGIEYDFNDTGEMKGYPNINRFENVDIVVRSRLYNNLWGFGKFGVTSSRYSYNGAINNYKASGRFNGYNAAVGLEYGFTNNIFLWGQAQVYYYESPSNPDTEGTTHPSIGLRLEF